MMFLTSAIALTSLLGLALAEPIPQKRANADISRLGQMYAYGTNLGGLPVFVADGQAYIGNVSLSNVTGAANVTFYEDNTSILVHQIHNNGTVNTTAEYFAIDTTDGAVEPVMISTAAEETGYTTDGFYLYGTQITWLTSERVIETNFYAKKTDVDDIFELYWNADTDDAFDGTSIVLKSNPPAHA